MNNLEQSTKFKGNVFLFYSLDIGDEIDLEKIKQKSLVSVKPIPLSPYFKNYHIPLAFQMDQSEYETNKASCISSKLHSFGALSLCYKIPFHDSLDDLKAKLIKIKNDFDQICESDAKATFHKILSTIKKARFYNLKSFYFAVQVEPLKEKVTPEDYKQMYGERIASLLRLETESLSQFQLKEILSTTTGYSGKDFMILDSEASFIYDDEYFEVLELFEFANIQLLELQYFDRLSDEKLNSFYAQSFKLPLRAYIPLLGERLNLPVSMLAQLRVDISVITERLEYSIKMAGDTYYSRVYSILREQLSLNGWRGSIGRKLDIIDDLYTVYQDRLDVIHDGILTLVIIILIAVEVGFAFWK